MMTDDTISQRIAAMMASYCQNPRTNAEVDKWEWQKYFTPQLRNAGFPDRFLAEIEKWNPDQRRVFEACDARCKNVGAVVALVGKRGVGKTAIATQLAIGRLREWRGYWDAMSEDRGSSPRGMALYRKMGQILMNLKALYSDYGSTDKEQQQKERELLAERSLLVIDELHDCEEQKLKNRILTDLVDLRYASRRDTILISNQTPEEFQATTGDSILSRLKEHGAIISCNWKSFR